MKIAITTDAIWPFTLGGSEIRNHEVAKRLVKKGHEVHIYGAKLWKGPNDIKIDNVTIHGVAEAKSLYDSSGTRKPVDPLKISIKILPKLIKNNYDIIDNAAFSFFNCYSTKFISLIKKTPLVLTWHQYFGDYLIDTLGKRTGKIAMILEKTSTKLTKNNLAVSNHVKNELIKRNIKQKNIQVIYNGADIKEIKKTKPLKEKFDLIFVGRLCYQKNLSLLIDSINLTKKQFPKIKICIIGDGDEKNKLLTKIKKLNLKDNFKFTGNLTNKNLVYAYLKSSKIFVLPSRLEGFPLTIIEANAAGLPIITTKTKYNNTTEYIKNNINGLVVKPNPKDFSQAIKTLLKNKKLRSNLSKKGLEKSKDFDWNKITEQQEKYYKKILNIN
ncbi:MAG: glycosyltransferase family 4 protein [archaeon]